MGGATHYDDAVPLRFLFANISRWGPAAQGFLETLGTHALYRCADFLGLTELHLKPDQHPSVVKFGARVGFKGELCPSRVTPAPRVEGGISTEGGSVMWARSHFERTGVFRGRSLLGDLECPSASGPCQVGFFAFEGIRLKGHEVLVGSGYLQCSIGATGPNLTMLHDLAIYLRGIGLPFIVGPIGTWSPRS